MVFLRFKTVAGQIAFLTGFFLLPWLIIEAMSVPKIYLVGLPKGGACVYSECNYIAEPGLTLIYRPLTSMFYHSNFIRALVEIFMVVTILKPSHQQTDTRKLFYLFLMTAYISGLTLSFTVYEPFMGLTGPLLAMFGLLFTQAIKEIMPGQKIYGLFYMSLPGIVVSGSVLELAYLLGDETTPMIFWEYLYCLPVGGIIGIFVPAGLVANVE